MTAERPRCRRSQWLVLLVGVGLAAACGSGEVAPVAPPQSSPTLDLALRILREGAAALPQDELENVPEELSPPDDLAAYEAAEVGEHEPSSLTQAARLGPAALRDFLVWPIVDSAVPGMCVRRPHAREERLVALLSSGHDDDRALALSVLVRVRAPRHIFRQWQVLLDLDQRHGADPVWLPLLEALHEPFATKRLEEVLLRDLGSDRLDFHEAHQWALRAVGVTGCLQLLPRVSVWTRSADVDVARAALQSLGELPGPEADQALADRVRGFGYVASFAGHVLLRRDPALLSRTLLATEVPADDRWYFGQLLARLEHPAAVPHLCAAVRDRSRVDREMFDAIERLATDDHWPLVAALPGTVLPEQRERAAAVVAAVRTRLQR